MKQNLQIQITPIASGIAVRGPYSSQNNESYKSVGGIYDRSGRRWILPDDDDSWELLYDLYGADGQIVVAAAEPKHLTTTGAQLQLGGYVVAQWNTNQSCVRLCEGVELIKGAWDHAKSTTLGNPCLMAGDSVFQVQVRHDFAATSSLELIAELGDEKPKNPLAEYSDDDLRTEFEDRGFKVERKLF